MIHVIYMAAGNSRRFGSNKLFYPIDGKPMYRHVLERLAAICERHSDWEIVLVSQYEELLEQGRPFAHRTVFSPEIPERTCAISTYCMSVEQLPFIRRSNMSKIKEVKARQVLDCKGRPVAEVDIITEKGVLGRAGASTGSSV